MTEKRYLRRPPDAGGTQQKIADYNGRGVEQKFIDSDIFSVYAYYIKNLLILYRIERYLQEPSVFGALSDQEISTSLSIPEC
jgi:hypothetical protein